MALLLRTDGRVERLNRVDGRAVFTLRELQALVGGYIECVPLADGDYLVLNEDGKRLQLPLNPAATELLHLAGGMPDDYVVGDALVATLAELNPPEDLP